MKAQDIKAGDKFTQYLGDEVIGGWTATVDAIEYWMSDTKFARVIVKPIDGPPRAEYFEWDEEVPID